MQIEKYITQNEINGNMYYHVSVGYGKYIYQKNFKELSDAIAFKDSVLESIEQSKILASIDEPSFVGTKVCRKFPENAIADILIANKDKVEIKKLKTKYDFQYIIKNFEQNFDALLKDFPDLFKKQEIDIWKDYYYYGATLEQIGSKYGVCRERIRQIKKSVNTKLQFPFYLDYITIGETCTKLMGSVVKLESQLYARQESAIAVLNNAQVQNANFLAKPLEHFNEIKFSVRATNVLKNLNVMTIGDLLEISEMDIFMAKNCGTETFNEIKNAKKVIMDAINNL